MLSSMRTRAPRFIITRRIRIGAPLPKYTWISQSIWAPKRVNSGFGRVLSLLWGTEKLSGFSLPGKVDWYSVYVLVVAVALRRPV